MMQIMMLLNYFSTELEINCQKINVQYKLGYKLKNSRLFQKEIILIALILMTKSFETSKPWISRTFEN